MKKKIYVFIIVILLVVVQVFNGWAGGNERIAQSTMTFLNIDPVARSVGIGEASTCMDNDINAIFHNPAGIAKTIGGAITLNHTQWIADIKQYGIALAYGHPVLGTFSTSFIYMDNGEIPRTIPDNSDAGFHLEESFRVNQLAFGIGYGRQLTERFSLGGQIKYVYQDLGPADIIDQTGGSIDTLQNSENKEGVFAIDIGTIYYVGFKDLRVAMSFKNFGTSIQYSYESFEIPQVMKIGIAMNILALYKDIERQELQIYINASNPNDNIERINIGGEYNYNDLIYIRAGYRIYYDEGNFSAGFGLTPSAMNLNFRIDYAYSDYGEIFGSVHRFTLGFKL
jgi:hypothetical protein